MMIQEKIQRYISKDTNSAYFGNTAIFEIPISELEKTITEMDGNKNLSLKLVTATDERTESGCFKIWYVFGVPKENFFIVPFITLKNTEEFPSLAIHIHKMWNYERKIKTFFGLTPVGHADLRPIILHENWPTNQYPLRKDVPWCTKLEDAHGAYQFQEVKGEGVYEIPVGPIHAGIIEPGHFRFSVAGESIVHVEPRLGYTHKGSEKLFETLSLADAVRLSEKISGDSSFSHSMAFCQALEQLSDIDVPKRARYLRVIYAELERLANHFGDIGAIMMDASFNFGGAHGARLREIIMRIHEELTENRFLRGVNAIGGVTKDIGDEEKDVLAKQLVEIKKDFLEVITVASGSISLLNRLKGTGVLSAKIAENLGVVGIPAKAVGILCDTRVDYPYAAYNKLFEGNIPTEQGGDVYARFGIRIQEVYASIEIIQKALRTLPGGSLCQSGEKIVFKKNAVAVSAVEGWRGEIVYFVRTDSHGAISRVAPRDPSFVNWGALGTVAFGNVVPDFPLINKSFNLSYSGNDL